MVHNFPPISIPKIIAEIGHKDAIHIPTAHPI